MPTKKFKLRFMSQTRVDGKTVQFAGIDADEHGARVLMSENFQCPTCKLSIPAKTLHTCGNKVPALPEPTTKGKK